MVIKPSSFLLGRGDSPKLIIVAIVLKMGLGLVHYVLVGPLIWNLIHPTLVIIPGYIYLVSFVCLFHAANSNPGTLPKYICQRTTTPPGLDSNSIELGNREFYPYMPRDSPDIKFIERKGKELEIKYCVSCEIYRPPRCAHCSAMDQCVRRFDHYCVWLNNSIGERNYVFFFWFVLLTWLQMIFVFAINLYLVISISSMPIELLLRARPTSIVLAVIMFFLLFSMTGLTGLHIYLCW
eukprot:NODE_299_length_11430_cov_0.261054.p7 type:complete len:237 gc:universal NODE_299_length_11430_cov_0.261054:3713-4423(+)